MGLFRHFNSKMWELQWRGCWTSWRFVWWLQSSRKERIDMKDFDKIQRDCEFQGRINGDLQKVCSHRHNSDFRKTSSHILRAKRCDACFCPFVAIRIKEVRPTGKVAKQLTRKQALEQVRTQFDENEEIIRLERKFERIKKLCP